MPARPGRGDAPCVRLRVGGVESLTFVKVGLDPRSAQKRPLTSSGQMAAQEFDPGQSRLGSLVKLGWLAAAAVRLGRLGGGVLACTGQQGRPSPFDHYGQRVDGEAAAASCFAAVDVTAWTHTPTGNSQPCVRRRYDAGDGPEVSDRCVPAKPCLVNRRHLLKIEHISRSI